MEFFKWINGKWNDILRVPLLAGVGYAFGAYMRHNFDLRIFLAFTVGITVLQTLIIYVVWVLLKRRRAKDERAYSESH